MPLDPDAKQVVGAGGGIYRKPVSRAVKPDPEEVLEPREKPVDNVPETVDNGVEKQGSARVTYDPLLGSPMTHLIKNMIINNTPLYSPPTQKQKNPTTRQSGKQSEQFNEFWQLYPRKVSKKTAARSYEKALKAGHKHEDILAGLQAQLAAGLFNQETKYQPHAATWLNGERWADEVEAVAAVSSSGGSASWAELAVAARAHEPQPPQEWKSIEELMAETDRQENHAIEPGNC